MGRVGSGAGLIRCNPRIIGTLSAAGVGAWTMTEGKGMRYWTFELDNAGAPTGTAIVEATMDAATLAGLATNTFSLGTFVPGATPPIMHIEYTSGAILAVRLNTNPQAPNPGWASGVFTVIGSAVP